MRDTLRLCAVVAAACLVQTAETTVTVHAVTSSPPWTAAASAGPHSVSDGSPAMVVHSAGDDNGWW